MLHYTQSQIWTAVACLTVLRDSKYPWAQADILRLWRVYNMMLQYKVQVYSVTNKIFEPKTNQWEAGCSSAVWVGYPTAKISPILLASLIKEVKLSYCTQEIKIMQNNEESTEIWEQRHITGVSLITCCDPLPCRIPSCKTSTSISACAWGQPMYQNMARNG